MKLIPLLSKFKGIDTQLEILFSRCFALVFKEGLTKESVEFFDQVYLQNDLDDRLAEHAHTRPGSCLKSGFSSRKPSMIKSERSIKIEEIKSYVNDPMRFMAERLLKLIQGSTLT